MDMERVSSFSSPRRVVPFPYEQPPGYDDLNLIAHNHLPDDNRKEEEEDDQRWNQEDNWLPITESRKGNTLTAAFHLICSGIGFQTLMLPVAFISLGWFWGCLCLLAVFAWQLYTIWLLVHLHEPLPGTRHSRYVMLSILAFGPKLGKFCAIFPTMYLSGGTCVMFIITGGSIMELLHSLVCGDDFICNASRLPGSIWFLIFISLAILMSQLYPNLNSVAPRSLIGSIAAVVYFTILWTVSISKNKLDGVSHNPLMSASSEATRIRNVINALGIIAISFRGHNVVLEIQGTLPSCPQNPPQHRMRKAVIVSYFIIALCVFPVAIGGYWVYGNTMPANGILYAVSKFHGNSTMKPLMGAIYLIMLIHFISAFQIYAMPVFDNLERIYVSKKKKGCPRWVKATVRVIFGGLTYFISMAFPFLGSLGPFVGSLTLPLTLAYPCFMWISLKKPKPVVWCLNFGVGCLGIILSVLLVAVALWDLVDGGLEANFFKPR
ncbi:hypothetical protein M9H77_33756 [Catharanthus roseus]|uniref:Uncharacterized protein n=1 Tax=Catharanthus roseus TaxID=4058 RepID=A0ACB9ZJ94_CATRO|nr:hypothetical protein M9H77_33756 [Catharanthus roseus]